MTDESDSDGDPDFDAEAFLERLREDTEFRDEVRDILGRTPAPSRRSLLKGAGTALGAGALIGGAGTATADPQGQLGTRTDPARQIYVDTITMSGPSRDIESVGTVDAESADLSGLSMAGNADMGGNDIRSVGSIEAFGGVGFPDGIGLSGNSIRGVGTIEAQASNVTFNDDVNMSGNDLTDVGHIVGESNRRVVFDNSINMDGNLISGVGAIAGDRIDPVAMYSDIAMYHSDIDMRGNDISGVGTIGVGAIEGTYPGVAMYSDIDMRGNDISGVGAIEGTYFDDFAVESDIDMRGNDISGVGTIGGAESIETNMVSVGAGTSSDPSIRFSDAGTGLYISSGNLYYTSGSTTTSL